MSPEQITQARALIARRRDDGVRSDIVFAHEARALLEEAIDEVERLQEFTDNLNRQISEILDEKAKLRADVKMFKIALELERGRLAESEDECEKLRAVAEAAEKCAHDKGGILYLHDLKEVLKAWRGGE